MVNEAAMDPERTDVMVTAVISKTYFSPSTAEANNGQQIWPCRASSAFLLLLLLVCGLGLYSINYSQHVGCIQTSQCLNQKENKYMVPPK